MNMTTKSIELLQDAQELLREAIRLIELATTNTDADVTADAYTIPTLKVLCDNDHDYLGRNPGNLEDLIELVTEPEPEPEPLEYLPGALEGLFEKSSRIPAIKSLIPAIKSLRREYGFPSLQSSLEYTYAYLPKGATATERES
jgi:hypothetical protein